MKSNSSEMLTEYIGQNPALEELFETLGETNDLALSQVQELLAIRNPQNDNAASETMRMMGINLDREIIEKRLPELRKLMQQLPEWRHANGTLYWPDYVSMLLGQPFSARRLYTTDYDSFYPTPLGTLIQDGGQWYKTTHVEIDAPVGLDLDISIRPSDINAIVQSLLMLGMKEQDAMKWAYDHVGLTPANDDPVQVQVRYTLMHLRLRDLFYEWAPIEEVLDGIKSTLNLGLTIFLTANTVVESVRRFQVGAPIKQSVKFLVPDFINGGTWSEIGVQVNYSDNTSITESAYVESDLIIERDHNKFRLEEPNGVRQIELVLHYEDSVQTVSTKLYPIGLTPDPDSVEIQANTFTGSGSTQVRVYGFFGTNKRDLTDSGLVTIESSLGVVQGNTITLPALLTDTEFQVCATFSGLADVKTCTDYVAKRSILQRVPTELEIEIPDQIHQGQTVNILSYVTYNDGTKEPCIPQYTLSSKLARIVEDKFSSTVMREDYGVTIVAEFGTPNSVRAVKPVMLRAPRSVLAHVEIILPDVYEKMYVTPRAMATYMSDVATPEQIANLDPKYIVAKQQIRGIWFGSEDLGAGIHSVTVQRPTTGEFYAPIVSQVTKHQININVVEGTIVRTFSKVFDVTPLEYVPQQIDINHGRVVGSGSAINLPTVCLYNTGQTFAAACSLTVEYVPSDSAKMEARQRTIKLQQQAVEAGEDPTQFDPDNPDYTLWIRLELIEGTATLHDPILERDIKMPQLYYLGDLHGTARIHMQYRLNEHRIVNYRDFQLVPERSLVTGLEIEVPTILFDRQRTFARLLATYEDNTQEYVEGTYSGAWPEQEDGYDLIQFRPGTYNGLAICRSVEGTEPTSIAEFRAMEVSKLPMFDDIGTVEQLKKSFYVGALVQVGKLYEDCNAQVIAQHFRRETSIPVILTMRPKTSLNNVVSSRIIGPTNITADINVASYSLAVTYRTNGIRKQVDGSYINVKPKEFEQEMTADWTILNHYLVDNSGTEPVLIQSDRELAVVDNIGDLTLIENVTCAIRLQASYTCDAQQVVRQILINVSKANTYVEDCLVLGQDIVYDQMAKNPAHEIEDGKWYIPYSLRVIFADGSEKLTTDAQWSIGQDTTVDAYIDNLRGFLYLPSGQISDGQIRINALYSDTDPRTGETEQIVGTRVIKFMTDQSIVSMAVQLPDSNIEPNVGLQAIATYVRRNDMEGSNIMPDADSVKFHWTIVESVPNFTLTDSGIFKFGASTQPQTVVIRCTITEQRTTMFRDLSITCLGVGYPQDLTISSFVNVRDNSEIQCTAWLGRSGGFQRENISDKCLWQIVNSRGDVVTVPGVSVDTKGLVRIGRLHSDTRFGVRASYIEGQARLSQMRFMNAFTSFPKFGHAPYGLNTLQRAEKELTSILRTNTGGTFVFHTDTDNYGYFMIHGSYGRAEFGASSDSSGNVNTGWRGMDGAKWPVTGDDGERGPIILQKSYDNVLEDILLYRTNERAFGTAVLTVRFTQD